MLRRLPRLLLAVLLNSLQHRVHAVLLHKRRGSVRRRRLVLSQQGAHLLRRHGKTAEALL